jgi:NitT/TauT family transport system substrate-binding protein
MQRSLFLVSVAGATVAPRLAFAQTLTPVRVASSPNDDLIAVLLGLENGAFRKAGLDVTLTKANSGSAVAVAVAGGAVDIGKSSLLSVLAARAKNLPFVLVAPSGIYTAEAPTAGLIVGVNSPIRTGHDMNGKTVGVSGLNDLTSLSTQAWVDQNGGDSKTLKFLEVPVSAIGESVASGRIDAGCLPNPGMAQAVASGKARLLAPAVSAIARRFAQAAFFSMADYVAKNKATVAAFRKVIEEGSAYANTHHAQMIPILAKFTGIDEKVIAAEPQQVVGTSLDVRLIQPLVDTAAKYGAIPGSFDARQMIDPGALGG